MQWKLLSPESHDSKRRVGLEIERELIVFEILIWMLRFELRWFVGWIKVIKMN
jgi:hypothetical protein